MTDLVHIANQNSPPSPWCGKEYVPEGQMVSVEVAIAEHRGKACQRCAARLSVALRGPDAPIDIEMHEGLHHAIVSLADPLIREDPTCERVMNVSATILQVAASTWLRYHQPQDLAEYFPFNEERFSKLAGWMYLQLQAELGRGKN
ncbi:MAG TPA: hypothetical protein DCQ33_16365 [Nitrospira sp.]|nr:hypothetical protein [Nitrospira sp.]